MNAMDYKYVRAWNIMMGSFDYYINSEVEKAKQDKAPDDAIYKNHLDKWVTVSEIKNEETKRQVADIAASLK